MSGSFTDMQLNPILAVRYKYVDSIVSGRFHIVFIALLFMLFPGVVRGNIFNADINGGVIFFESHGARVSNLTSRVSVRGH